jgi:hypothetical protein
MEFLTNWNFLTEAGLCDGVRELIVSDVRAHLLDYIPPLLVFFPWLLRVFLLF